MKKITLKSMFLCSLTAAAICAAGLSLNAFAEETGVVINEANFPDTVFRNYVSNNFDKDSNGSLSESEISAVTDIDVEGEGVSDLKGVEYFIELRQLNCFRNNLTTFDVSNNTVLTDLNCGLNKLTSLDLKNNKALERLTCYCSGLTEIDVSNNTNLTKLICHSNKIAELDVSSNTALTYLSCGYNKLSELDVSNNTNLTILSCDYNVLTELDISNNTSLDNLDCGGNYFTGKDKIKGLNENKLKYFVYDPQLTAVPISEVIFPDAKFRAYVSENFDTNKNGTLLNSEIFNVTEINVARLGCSDLTGIEYFTELLYLNCYKNSLTKLDVRSNKKLQYLYCNNNELTTLDVSENTALIKLDCRYNDLTTLDVSKNKALTILMCNNNSLTSLDVSNNTALTELSCFNNKLTTFDISQNTALKHLNCKENYLSSKSSIIGLNEDSLQVFYFDPQNVSGVETGDVNGDGKLNNTDIILLGRSYMAGDSAKYIAVADMNNDGKINNTDIILLGRLYMSIL